MKKITQLILLILCVVLFTACSDNKSASQSEDTSYDNISKYIATAPAVTDEMNNADYWIAKCDDANAILMDSHEIARINKSNEPTFEINSTKEITLSAIPEQISGADVTALLETYESPEDFSLYYAGGVSTTSDYWASLTENIDINSVDENITVKFAFTTERVDIKAAPTADFISEDAHDLHYDINAVAECAPFEPVAVLHESKDGKWYYIACYGYAGWAPKESLAICHSREEWLEYQTGEEFLTVTGREIRLAYDPYESDSSGQLVPMGTVLTLVTPEEAPSDFNGRSSYNSYIVRIPGRDENGYLKNIYSLVPVSDDVHIGYLPYTQSNVIKQAFKRLGDRYGWAGNYYANDCSGITREIYACFGFEFPRNGKAQIRMTRMTTHKVEGLTDNEKLEIISELPAGSLMYFPGHLMIYLGMENDTPYVISSVGSIATAEMAEGESKDVNSVIINSLIDTTRKTGQTWLHCITDILTCE